MIRLTAAMFDHGFTYTLPRGGQMLLTTGNRSDAAPAHAAPWYRQPLQLIRAAEQWGAVDIHEVAIDGDDES